MVQDPESVGTAFKTMSMRIRGAKTELEEAGLETDGMAESTAKLRQEILALSGVDIMLNANEFKSTYQIMDELADKWQDLTDIQQASVTELIAGKRQGNIVSSLMSNFDIAEKALQTSLNSSGSAMREHEKWQQSLEAQINRLKASWQGLSQAFMSSDFLKGALNGIISLVDGLTKLIDTLGTFPTLMGTVAAGFSLFKNQGFAVFNKDTKSIEMFGTALTGLKDKYGQIKTACDRYNSVTSKSASFQKSYGEALASSSSSLGKYLSGLNGANASFKGYVKYLVSSKVATIGLQVATTALNTALTMGLSFAIQLVVEGIMKLINAKKELAEEVDELTSKFQEEHNSLMNLQGDFDTTNESSMISRYEKLSKGVDNLGRNVSLTSEEYTEYQSIVNSIADQIPSLISGYDEQGNALLSVKGNVEALTEAYQKLIHAQNLEILNNSGKIEEDFANVVKDNNKTGWWGALWDTEGSETLNGKHVDFLEELYENHLTDSEEIENLIHEHYDGKTGLFIQGKVGELARAFEDAGIEGIDYWNTSTSEMAEALAKAMEENPEKIAGLLGESLDVLEAKLDGMKSIAQAKLSEAFDVSNAISGLNYGNIGEDLQAVAYQVVNSLDYKFLSELSESGKTVEQWTTEMLNQFNAISKADNAEIEAAFDLQTQFNGGEVSYGEYVEKLRNVEEIINTLNLDDRAKEQLKISLGLDENGIIDQYDALVKRLTSEEYDFNVSIEEAESLLNGLTAEEYAVAVEVISEMSNNNVEETADDIRAAIERELALQGISVKLNLEVEKANLEALSTAISESVSGAGLSETSMSAVEGMFSSLNSYDPSKLFERTANGIRLNSDELRKLNSEYKKTNVAELNKQMDSLGEIYNQTREELYKLTYGTDEYNNKARDLSAIEQQINDLEKLVAGYKGVTSAYQEWQMAEASGSQRAMYESLISGLENIDDEISRGWYDDSTIEYLELLTGEDLSIAGIERVKGAYERLDKQIKDTSYSIRDFFTVDDEGNSTNAGVYNFLDAIGQMEEEKFGGKDVVQRDKKGNVIGFNFDLVGGDEVIAEALGVSEELVQIMVRAADDAGFVVSMDGTYQQLDVLREKAQEAAESMNKILEKDGKATIDIDMNTTDIKDIESQLKSIMDTFGNKDGSINMSINGADEALTVASTLQSMLDKLTRPAYMDIQVSSVEDELQEPLRQLQEYRTKIEQLNQAKLHGADTSELEASIEECKNKVVEDLLEIQEQNPKLAAQIEIEGLTKEEIEKKVETGEITIPATIDIQLEMDEKLGILVDKALLDAGIIDGKEFEKRVNIYLSADVNNEDVENKTEQAINEATSNSDNKTEVPVEVEVKANKVYTSDLEEGVVEEVKTGAQGRLNGMGVDVDANVSVKAGKVDTSDVENKTKEAVEGENAETVAIETKVELEATIDEALGLIDKLEDKDITISIAVEGLDDVKELNKNIDLATNIEGDISDLSEYVKGAKELSKLDDNITSSVTANANGNVVSGDGSSGRLASLTEFKSIVSGMETQTISVNVTASVASEKINEAIDLLTKVSQSGVFNDYNASVSVSYTLGDQDSPKDKEAKVSYKIGTQEEAKDILATVNYELGEQDSPLDKTAKVNYELGTQDSPLDKTATVTYVSSGESPAAGTAHVDGTASSGHAFARGDWGIKGNGVALGGELGREIVVRDGKFFTIGDNGAEFFRYKKNDIIFNAAQTESLFKYGGIKGANPRGKMLASGSAFSSGSGGAGKVGSSSTPKKTDKNTTVEETDSWILTTTKNSDGSTTKHYEIKPAFYEKQHAGKSSGSSGGSGGGSDEFEETFDWIEIAVDRIERVIDNLDRTIGNVYESWADRNEALLKQITEVENEIALQQQAYERYMAEAEKVGLDESWAKKVREGEIDITVLTDGGSSTSSKKLNVGTVQLTPVGGGSSSSSDTVKEKSANEILAEKIKEYQEWYEKALDCQDAIEELKQKESELYAQRVENVASQYEGILGVIEHEKNMLEEYINQSETQAWLVSANYYSALVNNEKENLEELENQKAEMINAFNDAMESGTIVEGSEGYYDLVNQIDEVTLAIAESETQLLEYQQTIQQLSWETFDLLQEKISSIVEETEFLIELMSSDKLFEDNGQLTNEGKATMGLHGVAYNIYMHQADQAAQEIERLKKELEKDPYDTELEERYREMIALQQEYILSAQDEKEAIRDLVSEGIEYELEALQELIDKKNEQLQSEKDLYEYSKKVKESTEEIASLEKQMAAYSNDNSEEAQQKIQQIKVELESAKEDLQETEYDKFINDSATFLDELYLEYETILNTRLDNLDYLIEQMIAEINSDAFIIGDTIRETADSVGYTLTDSMKSIWDENSVSTKNVITTYGDKFLNAQTTTNNALNTINANLQNMINQLNKIASTKTKSASTSSVSKISNTNKTVASQKPATVNSSGGDGTPKIGDRVKFVSGQYYYDSQGKKPLGSHKQGEYVYITNINKKKWATHGYHISTGSKLGKGDLGWLKLNQLSGYATGKRNFLNDEVAWTQENGQEYIVRPSDGAILTPVAKGDSILTSAASNNIWDMANSPAEFIKDNLSFGTTNVPNNSNIQSNYTQVFDKVIFSLPNVKNYDELITSMKKDPNFERLIDSMTIGRLAGKSNLAKNKSIR